MQNGRYGFGTSTALPDTFVPVEGGRYLDTGTGMLYELTPDGFMMVGPAGGPVPPAPAPPPHMPGVPMAPPPPAPGAGPSPYDYSAPTPPTYVAPPPPPPMPQPQPQPLGPAPAPPQQTYTISPGGAPVTSPPLGPPPPLGTPENGHTAPLMAAAGPGGTKWLILAAAAAAVYFGWKYTKGK